MHPPTIKDVAKHAGVGVGTVSRVLNGSSRVREETRQKVLATIKALGFSPNAAARQLSGGKTFTIGVITAFFTFPSFVERLIGIQDVLDESEYDLVLYSIRTPDQLYHRLRILVNQNRVDGLLILSLPFSEDEIRAANPNLPIVVVDNDIIQHYPRIAIDNVKGGELATNYLIEKGHQHIGFIGDPIENPFGFTSTRKRFEGYQRALEQAGLKCNPDWCLFGQYSQEAARHHAAQIFNLPQRPTAIFVAIDTLAFGVLEAARDAGLDVPDDIAVMGFDDIRAANYMRLTTVRQHLMTSGQLGAQLMLDWLTTGSLEKERWQTTMPFEIIERATV
jgi:DNA-binding LacI/PurR family transcriptional regulator